MKTLRRVIWAEGMFLGQQHFQLWDQYHESCRALQTKSVAPLSWGIVSMSHDEQALQNGVFRVRACEAIFPDGRLVKYQEQDAPALTLEVNDVSADRTDVFLCLPSNGAAHGISGYQDQGRLCGWSADYRTVTDENDPAREREVMLGNPNLLLLDGSSSREHVSAIKVAELVNEGDHQFSVRAEYVPPVTSIGAASFLVDMTQRLVELFRAKIRALNERRRQTSSSGVEFGHGDLSNFLILHTLSSALPVLQHCRAQLASHPQELYLLLARVIGGLSPFSTEIEAQSVPRYEHENMGPVFETVEQQLRILFDMAMPSKIAPIKLARESDVLYSIDAIDSSHLGCGLYLAVKSDKDDPMWVKHFEKMIKLGSRSDIEMIVASALPGVRVVHTQRPPSNLPIKSGYEYFRIEKKGDYWDKLAEAQTMGIFLSRDFSGASIDMLTVQE